MFTSFAVITLNQMICGPESSAFLSQFLSSRRPCCRDTSGSGHIDAMEKLQALYAVAIGVGFGGIAFAITYHIFQLVQKGRLLGNRRGQLAAT